MVERQLQPQLLTVYKVRMHYVMIFAIYSYKDPGKQMFLKLNVPHKDFGCSNDHFVNEL